MQFLECKYFNKMLLLVFVYAVIRWISSLFTINYQVPLSKNNNNIASCHPLEKGDPSTNTTNSLQPLFNST